MKYKFTLLIFLFFASVVAIYAQSVSNVSINGIFTEYKLVKGSYDIAPDTLTGPGLSFQWLSYDDMGNDPQLIPGAITDSLVLDNSHVGRRLMLVVSLSNIYADYIASDSSALSPVVIQNSKPSVQNAVVIVLSGLNVGDILLADYDYYDADDDPEGVSTVNWYRSETPGGTLNPTGNSGRFYNIHMADTGKYLAFRVTPLASTGDTDPGTEVTASSSPKINNAPYIENLSIPLSATAGSVITPVYEFHDPDSGDDDACLFRWFRDGVEFINPDNNLYNVLDLDQGTNISVQVTAVSDGGYPDTGNTLTSGACYVNLSALPLASDVCISGTRDEGEIIKVEYEYDDNGLGGDDKSWIEWLVDGAVAKEGQTSYLNRRFTLHGDTADADIQVRVTPRKNATITGTPVTSDFFAKIDNAETNLSVSSQPVALSASPQTGEFIHNAVYLESDGIYYFDPGDTSSFDINNPVVVTHYIAKTTTGGCSQTDRIAFNVNPATTYFMPQNKDIFCYSSTSEEIAIGGLPGNYMGNGTFSLEPDIPGGMTVTSDRTVTIYPQVIGPRVNGPEVDLIYSYSTLEGIQAVNYRIRKKMIVDSIGVDLAISGLADNYCEEDDSVLVSVVNFYPSDGRGTWEYLDTDILSETSDFNATIIPSAKVGGGAETITYTYELPSGCSAARSGSFVIHPTPRLQFDIEDGCIDSDTDTTRFVNLSPDSLLVESWNWDFGENFPSISTTFEPSFMYRTEGIRHIRLVGVTYNGCRDTIYRDIPIGVKPEGNFYWEDDCFTEGEDLRLFDATLPTATIESRRWEISHSDGTDILVDELNPVFSKLKPEVLGINYYLFTAYPDCQDTVVKNVYIRPLYSLRDSTYSEDFEGSGKKWVSDGVSGNTWMITSPEHLPGLPSDSLWYSGIPTGPVNYSVESPCFDFKGVSRPMISMDIIRSFDKGRDGAVLQYKVGDSPLWENVGGTDYGINWYDNSNISGRPGGSVVGWSPDNDDDTLVCARQYLDELIGKEDVKLRIVYGSDGNAVETKGFAFDNVWIGERTRNVLVEHFTNYNTPAVIDADNVVNSMMEDIRKDAVNIQYHTNYRAGDQLYLDNDAVPSARMMFYSLVSNPFTLFDGGTSLNFAGRFDWLLADASVNALKNRGLVDPFFGMKIDMHDDHEFAVQLKPIKDVSASNMTLYIALLAGKITELTGDNGENEFYNVARRMLPDAGGIVMKKEWKAEEDTTSLGPYSLYTPWLHGSDSIEVVAFLQNNITKQVYQAVSSGRIKVVSTSTDRLPSAGADMEIYPNPAVSRVNFLFDRETERGTRLLICSGTGAITRIIDIDAGTSVLTVDDIGLESGIYIVKLVSANMPVSFGKLVIR